MRNKERDQKTFVEIPVGFLQGEKYYVVFNTIETDALIGKVGIVVQSETLEQAKAEYLKTLMVHLAWTEKRSRELDRWKPFQKGTWGKIGGTWFTVFGINVYFRRGKEMKGGWYIPFTKLNISINNHWKHKLKA